MHNNFTQCLIPVIVFLIYHKFATYLFFDSKSNILFLSWGIHI